MPILENKESLLSEIHRSYFLLKSDLQLIPADRTRNLELDGHQKNSLMSVHNLVSYLIGWGELLLKWQHLKTQNLRCELPDTGYEWNELGRLAQKFYKDYQVLEYEELLLKFDVTVSRITALVEHLDNDVLYGVPFHGKWPLGRLIQLNSSSPYKNARARLTKWNKDFKG